MLRSVSEKPETRKPKAKKQRAENFQQHKNAELPISFSLQRPATKHATKLNTSDKYNELTWIA